MGWRDQQREQAEKKRKEAKERAWVREQLQPADDLDGDLDELLRDPWMEDES